MTRVKICGITNLEDAQIAIDSGADAIGFNFYRGSKRFVDERDAAVIIQRIQGAITTVGVFVNHSIAEILETQSIAKFDVIQLHGDETQRFVNELRSETNSKIIKAFRVSAEFDVESVDRYNVDAVLLDSFSTMEYGGTGNTLDWNIAAKAAARFSDVYLAGGLTPDNVALAIRKVKPSSVDVASGVESSPGKKDPIKVATFMKSAKEAI
jgi:phosphoribosylanthranilate isomerase